MVQESLRRNIFFNVDHDYEENGYPKHCTIQQ